MSSRLQFLCVRAVYSVHVFGRFFCGNIFVLSCSPAYKHHGGGVMYHAPCSSTAVSCLSGYASALLVPKGAGGPKAETPIYVLSFDYLIFRLYFPFYVDFPYTSRSGGANGTRACICVFLVGT